MKPTVIKIRKKYDQHSRVQHINKEPSRTKQAFAEECDINQIMLKYKNTGLLTHVNNAQAQYGDFSNVPDYHTALNQIQSAQDSFLALPAHIRAKFNNDPQDLIQYLNDETNYDDALKLGLINPRPPKIEKPNPTLNQPDPTKPPTEA